MADRPSSPRPSPAFSVLAFLLPLGILAILWGVMDSMEDQREKAWFLSRHQHLVQVLPLLRERATPFSVILENLTPLLHPSNMNKPGALADLGPELLRRLGSGTRLMVGSPTGEVIFSHGFSPERNGPVNRLIDFILLQEKQKAGGDDLVAVSSYSNLLFHHNIPFILGWNNITGRFIPFEDEPGFFLMGAIPRSFPRLAANLRSGTLVDFPATRPSRKIWGALALFVPTRNLKTWSRFQRQFAGPHPSLEGTHHLIRSGSPADLDRLPPVIAAELAALPDQSIQGTIQKAGWEAAYHVMPWTEQGKVQPKRILGVFVRRASPPIRSFRTFRGTLMFLFLGGGLMAGIRRWSAGRSGWGPKLLGKFAFLSGLAILVPTFGLWWVAESRQSFTEAMKELDQFRLLEDRLGVLENRLRRRQGATLAALKRVVGDPAWEQGQPTATLASLAPRLRDLQIQVVILALPGQPPLHHLPGGPDSHLSSHGNQATTVLKALVTYLLEAILRETGSKKSGSIDGPGGAASLLIEPIALSLGPLNLYDMAATRGILHPFGLLQESTWISTLARRGKDHRPLQTFLFILDRLSLQALEGIEWVLETAVPPGRVPPFMVYCPQRRDVEGGDVIPCWGEIHPVLRQLLYRCEKEGAVPRMTLNLDGRRVFCLGRKLTGSDLCALALEEDPPTGSPDLVGRLRSLAVGYPLLIALLSGLLVWGFLLRPLHDLQQGVRAISAGNFNVRLPILTDDEIGTLCQSFNHVAQELEEKEFLERFLSTTALEQVRAKQSVAAATTHGSVLFADIRGFTHLSETLAPDEIVALLNAYLTRMETVIAAEGGTIDKFIGDALMAVFLPSHGMGNPAERATRAGLAMRRALAGFNRERTAQGLFPIDIGVGIATGEILMGRMGREDDRREFVLTGRTVNRAALMEKQSKAGRFTRVILCPATVAALAQPRPLHELSPLPDGTVPCEIAITEESSHA